MAVAGSEGDAAEGGEGGGDVCGRYGLEVLAGLDAEAHQQNGDMLIVVVGNAVAGAVGARLPDGSAVQEPVRFRQDEEVAATSGKITIGESENGGAFGGGAVTQLFGAIDGGDAGLLQRSVQRGLHGGGIVLQLLVDAGHKVNIAAADTCNGGLWIFEACEGLLNSFPQLRQM